MTMDPIRDIKPGLPVFTRDGDQIGEVKEVGDAAFKVNAPMQPDYWLRRDAVLAFNADRVTMDFTHDQLGQHKAAPATG